MKASIKSPKAQLGVDTEDMKSEVAASAKFVNTLEEQCGAKEME